MTLEAAVFPYDVLTYSFNDLYNSLTAASTHNFRDLGEEWSDFAADPNLYPQQFIKRDMNSSPSQGHDHFNNFSDKPQVSTVGVGGASRRKRRRTKSFKNKEEAENQRMIHIAVERNRRKQMNEYLGALRSLMPPSYVQRRDQASIIGGAINFVKELEQLLHSLEAQKRMAQSPGQSSPISPFADFFTFPQYPSSNSGTEGIGESRSAMADIEVTVSESHANVKVLTEKRPKQLLKIVSGLQSFHLTVPHLNVTTHDHMALYSFSLKVEDECGLSSVDEIAAAVHQIIVGINQAEAH